MRKSYSKEEIVIILQDLYNKIQKPITNKILKEMDNMPTEKVFKRLFGNWQNACKETNIPFQRKIENCGRKNEINRLGEEKIDSLGCVMKIVKYNNANDIIVEFQDIYKGRIHTNYSNWKKNNCKNPFSKNKYGGYLGNTVSKINNIKKDSYKVWYAMLQRCYKECYDNKPTYYSCEVCDEWLCYANFEKWYDKNYYQIDNEVMNLDKDILCRDNKIYSPETCIFVPQSINKLFTKHDRFRGNYLLGVSYDNRTMTYYARCNKFGKEVHLGNFPDELSAFKAYKFYKEKYIKDVADLYKSQIPNKLYNAMYLYQVKITD